MKPTLIRLAVYVVCGSFSGVVAATASVFIEFMIYWAYAYSHGGWSALTDHREFWSPLRQHFWDIAWQKCPERWLGGWAAGLLGGAVTARFPKPSRHPASVTVVWASIVGSVRTALIFFLSTEREPLLNFLTVLEFLAMGAIYGFLLSILGRPFERSPSGNPNQRGI